MNLLKAASTVSLFTLASRITGLIRELLMASTFGASAMTDAFNVAWRIPNLFRRLFGEGAFSQAFVPTLAARLSSEGDEAARRLIASVATVLVWALLATCVIGVVGAPLLVWSMASGLQQDPRGLNAAIVMTRFMFPYIGFMSLVAMAAGVLNTWKRFAMPAATPVLLNLAWIAGAWWGAPWFKAHGIEPIYALAGAVMVGGVLQLAVQLPALLRLGLLPRIAWQPRAIADAWNDAGTRQVIRLMLPTLLGVGVAQFSMLINTQIASHLSSGSVSWISYADRLMEFPTALLGVALGVVLMPQLAGARATGDGPGYSRLLDWGLRLVVLLGLPSSVALLVFAEPLVATLLYHGSFTLHDVQQTSAALVGYGVGLLGLVAVKVLAPGYYANQDTRTPVKIAIGVLVFTQVLNALLVPHLRHAALTLSISIGALCNALWLLGGLIRRRSYRPEPGWLVLLLQTLVASALLAGFLYWARTAVPWTAMKSQTLLQVGWLAGVLLLGAVIYFAALAATGVKWRRLVSQ